MDNMINPDIVYRINQIYKFLSQYDNTKNSTTVIQNNLKNLTEIQSKFNDCSLEKSIVTLFVNNYIEKQWSFYHIYASISMEKLL